MPLPKWRKKALLMSKKQKNAKKVKNFIKDIDQNSNTLYCSERVKH